MKNLILSILDKILDAISRYIRDNVCRGNHSWVSDKTENGHVFHYCERCITLFKN